MTKRSRFIFLTLFIILFLTACGGGRAGEIADDAVDEETGMLVNPADRKYPEPYLVMGTIKSMNLIPAARPEFLVVTETGRQYRVYPQPVGELTFEDGTPIKGNEIKIGMPVRATVSYDGAMNGGLGGLRSEDFHILLVIATE